MKKRDTGVRYLTTIKEICDSIDLSQIRAIIRILERKLKGGKMIFVCGNGGSAATASHFACDLMKTSNEPFKAVCLNDDIPLMTAIANDLDYGYVFSFQLAKLASKGDLLVVITGSGNSANIVEAVRFANSLGIETVAFLGKGGGKVKDLVDEHILIPSNEYGPIEDFHMILVHLITEHFKKNGS